MKKQIKRNRMSIYAPDDVIKELDRTSKSKDEIRRYFHYDSDLCRALIRYLATDPDCHCFLRLDSTVNNSSAGYGAHMERTPCVFRELISSNGGNKWGAEKICYDFYVNLTDENDTEYRESVSVSFPVSWETHFSMRKFAAWVREGKRAVKANKDLQLALRLARKHKIQSCLTRSFVMWI